MPVSPFAATGRIDFRRRSGRSVGGGAVRWFDFTMMVRDGRSALRLGVLLAVAVTCWLPLIAAAWLAL
jgi:hypothetical protein